MPGKGPRGEAKEKALLLDLRWRPAEASASPIVLQGRNWRGTDSSGRGSGLPASTRLRPGSPRVSGVIRRDPARARYPFLGEPFSSAGLGEGESRGRGQEAGAGAASPLPLPLPLPGGLRGVEGMRARRFRWHSGQMPWLKEAPEWLWMKSSICFQ